MCRRRPPPGGLASRHRARLPVVYRTYMAPGQSGGDGPRTRQAARMAAFVPARSEQMSDTGTPYADTRDMYAAHTAFRREFGLLPALVRNVAAHDNDRVRVVTDHIKLLNHFLQEHHAAEDAFPWPKLLARAPKETDPVVHL